ncbi:nitrate ABC transporter substrate-binding protein [Intrasporangium chromatireducens Q5-1]|uniref:Nitrate ABC transporter substrate-binding protein n=1 Tax=Intrasporangium chromatireducens Q5-1 TaxID=584657 RepID=W9GEA1_9MICO|nr:ABC transporter substrate-binding protein [Intrasporangium chromatireducens]EWT04405.1 nitrate ABC transporter substrate-binding protein [Intrasporangium chromatireducens Q5-1]
MRASLKAAAGAAAVAVLLAACGSSGSPTPSGGASGGGSVDQVKVGVIPIVDVAPIYLGAKKGFFDKRNIKVSMESGQGGAAIVPGVASGQFQFGFSNVTSLIIAKSKNLPIKVVAAGNSSTGVDGKDFSAIVVKADSPIQSAKDLAGKTVSINTLKNIGDTTVRQSVQKAGGDPSSVKFVELAFPDMPAAVKEGRVDAAWVVEPFVTIAKQQGDRVIASNLVDTFPKLQISTYFTSEQTAKSNPDLVKRFTEAMNESLTYAQEHPDEARDILSSYTKIDPSVAKEMTLPLWEPGVNKESLQKLADLAAQEKLIDNKLDVNQLLN